MKKFCKTCGTLKNLSEFYKHPLTKDGLFPECKECNIKRASSWQKSNWDKKLANDRNFWHKHKKRLIIESRIDRDNREYGGNRYFVLDRDKHRCVICGLTEKEHLDRWGEELHCDHIDRNRKNNSISNLRSICIRCHGSIHGKQSPTKFKKTIN